MPNFDTCFQKSCSNVDDALDPKTILSVCSKTGVETKKRQSQGQGQILIYVFENPRRNVDKGRDPKTILDACSKTGVDM